MSQDQWTAVDRYLEDLLVPHDPALEGALHAADQAGLPPINVAPNQGKLLHVLARALGARRILEIGTLGGYSTIWLARALPPDGHLLTLEADPRHAEVARANVDAAGVGEQVTIHVGPALDTLPRLQGPFDLVFVDADKQHNTEYLDWGVRLGRPGTLVVVDNVIRRGAVADAASTDDRVVGTRRFFSALAADSRVTATALQTVGSKGHDGLAFAVVR